MAAIVAGVLSTTCRRLRFGRRRGERSAELPGQTHPQSDLTQVDEDRALTGCGEGDNHARLYPVPIRDRRGALAADVLQPDRDRSAIPG